MRIIQTDFRRLKSLQASPDGLFFSVVSNESIAFWSMDDVDAAFAKNENDLMV